MLDERTSAFLDDECDARTAVDVIRVLECDAEQRSAWQRQLWLREALQGAERLPRLDPAFVDRVGAALAAAAPLIDDRIAAPAPHERTAATKVVSLSARRRRWAGAGGLAAAAAVAGIAVLVTDPLSTDSLSTEPLTSSSTPASIAPAGLAAGNQTLPTAEPAGSAAVAVASATSKPTAAAASPQSSGDWSVSDTAVEDRLNGYLIDHSGLARGYGLSGATPSFVRVAAYGQDGRP